MVLERIALVLTLYVLTTIIRNIVNSGNDIFCAFIELEKAINWVNRALLFHKLLELNIDGNIYYAIKSVI